MLSIMTTRDILDDYDRAVKLWRQAIRMPDPPLSTEDHRIYLDLLYWSRKLVKQHGLEYPGSLASGGMK